LHETQARFLHPAAPARAEDHNWSAFVVPAFERPSDFLARDRSHRTAHEAEVGDSHAHWYLKQSRPPADHAVRLAGLLLGELELRTVIRKLQRVRRSEVAVGLPDRPFVNGPVHSLPPAKSMVV